MNEFEAKKEEFFNKYKDLPIEDKLNVIAKAFGWRKAVLYRQPCRGKWRGNTDVFINGLYIGTKSTPETKKKSVQNEMINEALRYYNPEMVRYCRKLAWTNLKKLEPIDNARGLKPYRLYSINLNRYDNGFCGWWYVTLLIDGKRVNFKETNLYYAIKNGYTEKFLEKTEYRSVDKNPVFCYNGYGHSL